MFIWRPSGQRDRGVVIKKDKNIVVDFHLQIFTWLLRLRGYSRRTNPVLTCTRRHQADSNLRRQESENHRTSPPEGFFFWLISKSWKVVFLFLIVGAAGVCHHYQQRTSCPYFSMHVHFLGRSCSFLLEWKTWRKSTVKGPFVLFRLTIS